MTELELTELLRKYRVLKRVKRKSSLSKPDEIRQAICAFANDLPDHRLPGVLFVGVQDIA
jgi:ATP-dependent DNA helicase RecG